MLNLSANSILLKNKLESDGSWLILLKIDNLDIDPIYLVRNTDNVTWNGQEYIAFPFQLDALKDDSSGTIQSVQIKISNITNALVPYLEASKGGVGAEITLYVVNSKLLNEAEPAWDFKFSVLRTTVDTQWCNFTLGSSVQLKTRRHRRYLKNSCSNKYGDAVCGVSAGTKATYPTCNRTLTHCLERGNSARYGGFASITQDGMYI